MHRYINIYVCMNIYVYVCTCIDTCLSVYMNVCNRCMYVHTYIHICLHTCIHLYMHAGIDIHTHIQLPINIPKCIHLYCIHTYIHTSESHDADGDQKSHVAPCSDRLVLRNVMMPLIMPSRLCDADTGANGIIYDQKSHPSSHLDCYELTNAMVPFMMSHCHVTLTPIVSHDESAKVILHL